MCSLKLTSGWSGLCRVFLCLALIFFFCEIISPPEISAENIQNRLVKAFPINSYDIAYANGGGIYFCNNLCNGHYSANFTGWGFPGTGFAHGTVIYYSHLPCNGARGESGGSSTLGYNQFDCINGGAYSIRIYYRYKGNIIVQVPGEDNWLGGAEAEIDVKFAYSIKDETTNSILDNGGSTLYHLFTKHRTQGYFEITGSNQINSDLSFTNGHSYSVQATLSSDGHTGVVGDSQGASSGANFYLPNGYYFLVDSVVVIDNTPDYNPPVTICSAPSGEIHCGPTGATLTATDNHSGAYGLDNIYYSFDGVNFVPYTTPLEIYQTSTLYYYATDLAGNKEDTKARQFTIVNPVSYPQVSCEAHCTDITLDWNDVTDADYYRVYRDGAQIGTVTEPGWTDSDPGPDQHCYAVASDNFCGSSALSDPVCCGVVPYGSIGGYCTGPAGPMGGVEVRLFDDSYNLLDNAYSDNTGMYLLSEVPNGSGFVECVTPMGFAPVTAPGYPYEICGEQISFNFEFADASSGKMRSFWWWQDQLADLRAGVVPFSGITEDSINTFCQILFDHFYDRSDGYGIHIDGMTCIGSIPGPLDFDYLTWFFIDNKDTDIPTKMKKNILTIMLNVAAGRLSQLQEVSTDGSNVSQAITYYSMVLTSGIYTWRDWYYPMNIQMGYLIPEGTIPPGIPVILYKEETDIPVETLPVEYTLFQNHPNPFNPITEISFYMPEASRVELSVYNVLGQKIETIANGYFEAGTHVYKWDASRYSSGVYFYHLKTDRFEKTMKMTLLK